MTTATPTLPSVLSEHDVPLASLPTADPDAPSSREARTEPHLSILRDDPEAAPLSDAGRLVTGAGLSALLGVAIGLPGGLASVARHALGVPAGVLAVCAFTAPSLWVMLSLASLPLSPQKLLRVIATGVARTGLLFAGLAPAAALFCVSANGGLAAALGAGGCLAVGAALGLRALVVELLEDTKGLGEPKASLATLGLAVFSVLATALAARVWLAALPVLHP